MSTRDLGTLSVHLRVLLVRRSLRSPLRAQEAAKPPASEPDAEGADAKAAEKRDAKKSREEVCAPTLVLRIEGV